MRSSEPHHLRGDPSTVVSAALKADSIPMRTLVAARRRGTLALS
jgi:hypothetical protein